MAKRVRILAPRLDVTFKEGPVPGTRGPVPAIRQPWADFVVHLAAAHQAAGDSVEVYEKPLWQFSPADAVGCDRVYIPHKEAHQFPIHPPTEARYYAQTQFPWLFSCDPRGWGSGASVYPISPAIEDIPWHVPSEQRIYQRLLAHLTIGETKFSQPVRLGSPAPLPTVPYVFFPCQLPHDETIRYHSSVTVEDALRYTIEATHQLDVPLVVKGHPVNPGSMAALKALCQPHAHVQWIDEVHILDAINRAAVVVTVNSGTGFEVLLCSRPLVVLGRAEYDRVAIKIPDGSGGAAAVATALHHVQKPHPLIVEAFFEKWGRWCVDTTDPGDFTKLLTR